MDFDHDKLQQYLGDLVGERVRILGFSRIGEPLDLDGIKGFGYGEPLLVEFEHSGKRRRWVLSTMRPGRHGHEHMEDRAQAILWSHRAFNSLPRHARAMDVGAYVHGGGLRSLADVEEFFLAVEYVEGRDYHEDLERLRTAESANDLDIARADALCDFLVEIHSVPGPDPGLYNRRVRELLGHGECVMGIVDSYPLPSGFLTAELLESVEHDVLRWCWKLRGRTHRIRQVHGDYHPWNLLFHEGADLRILDRSRGEWGEPADDLTCITMNLLFYSLQEHGALAGAYEQLWHRIWDRYLAATKDDEILEVCAPFFAFRGLVMASPLWYPTLAEDVRRQIFRFFQAEMKNDRFDPAQGRGLAPLMRSPEGFALWITGWPGSGKSVLTAGLVAALHDRGVHPVVLESDVMRRILTPEPTYTDEDRDRFYGMLADLAALFVSQRLSVIVDATASRRAWRDAARARIPRFAEVFVDTPPEVCIARDPKGLYRAAREGRSAHVPGVQAVYEPPTDPEITLSGAGEMAPVVASVLELLRDRRFL